jgi:hypothetical protein
MAAKTRSRKLSRRPVATKRGMRCRYDRRTEHAIPRHGTFLVSAFEQTEQSGDVKGVVCGMGTSLGLAGTSY